MEKNSSIELVFKTWFVILLKKEVTLVDYNRVHLTNTFLNKINTQFLTPKYVLKILSIFFSNVAFHRSFKIAQRTSF